MSAMSHMGYSVILCWIRRKKMGRTRRRGEEGRKRMLSFKIRWKKSSKNKMFPNGSSQQNLKVFTNTNSKTTNYFRRSNDDISKIYVFKK
jgi:hypothetical protein